jgi:hypothetical protein
MTLQKAMASLLEHSEGRVTASGTWWTRSSGSHLAAYWYLCAVLDRMVLCLKVSAAYFNHSHVWLEDTSTLRSTPSISEI